MSRNLLIAAFLLSPAQFAHAQDGSAPLVNDESVIAPASSDWTGFYAGIDLGLTSGAYSSDSEFPGDGDGDLSGAVFGVSLGYNFQRNNLVFGAEYQYSGANIEGTDDCANAAFECALEVDALSSLRARAGYDFAAGWLLIGNIGFANADSFGFVDDGSGAEGDDVSLSGITYGISTERMINSSLSWEVGIQRYEFDAEDYETDITYEDVQTNITTLDVGLNYRF